MRHLARGINPNSNINVATVYPNGTVKVWKSTKGEKRPFLYSRAFPTYGAAKLWAAEFEDTNRRMKLKEQE